MDTAIPNIPGPPPDAKLTAKQAREYHLGRLDDRIAKFNSLVTGECYVYLDTLQFFSPWKYIRDTEREALGELSYDAVYTHRKDPRSVIVQRPSPEAICYIEEKFPDHKITRHDLGVEYPMPRQAIAEDASDRLGMMIYMKWHNDRETNVYKGTWYLAKRGWQRRNIAGYADDEGKIWPGPVAHFDLRYFSTAVCKTHGIRRAADVFDLDWRAYIGDAAVAALDWHHAEQLVEQRAYEELHRSQGIDHDSLVRRFKRLWCAAISGDGSIPEFDEYLENYASNGS